MKVGFLKPNLEVEIFDNTPRSVNSDRVTLALSSAKGKFNMYKTTTASLR